MLLVKTVSQFTHTYQVPDALTGDFLRWLNNNEDTVGDYEVDQQFLNEMIIHAARVDDPRPGSDTEQAYSSSNTGTSTRRFKSK